MIQRHYKFKVENEYRGFSILDYLNNKMPEFHLNKLKKMFYKKYVYLNEVTAKMTDRIEVHDDIKLKIPKEDSENFEQDIPEIEVLFEEEEFLILNKPAGMAVIPERWSRKAILKNAVKEHFSNSGENFIEPRIVHRIDKDTSGALIIAKSPKMERELSKLFEERKIKKEYLAIVSGNPPDSGTIDLPISQTSKKSSHMSINMLGKKAITNFQLLEVFHDFALLKVNIETGRTHQIRVHLASQGFPLAVDPMYGYRNSLNLSEIKKKYIPKKKPEKPIISRLTLHSFRISFQLNGKDISVEAPIPKDFEVVLKKLRKYRPQGKLVENY